MKKLAFMFVALTAMTLASCGDMFKKAPQATDTLSNDTVDTTVTCDTACTCPDSVK